MKDLLTILKHKRFVIPLIVAFVILILAFTVSLLSPSSTDDSLQENIPTSSPNLNISSQPKTFITEEDFNRQNEKESNFAKFQENVARNYPWYDQLPLQASTYFVYFDVDKKSFVGLLYPTESAKNETVSQIVIIKAQVKKTLRGQNIPFEKYPFRWEIKPEKREISITSPENRPGLQSKETLPDSTIKYTYLSSNSDRTNIIITKSGDIIFQRNITSPDLPIQVSDYTESYGMIKWIFKGSNFHGPEAQTYIYPEIGIAFIANPKTGDVLEQHVFAPTKVEDYVKKYGEDIPAQP